jgi:hypothetical protein
MKRPNPRPLPCLTPARTPRPLHRMERDERKEDSSVRKGRKKRSQVLVEPSKLRPHCVPLEARSPRTTAPQNNSLLRFPFLKGKGSGVRSASTASPLWSVTSKEGSPSIPVILSEGSGRTRRISEAPGDRMSLQHACTTPPARLERSNNDGDSAAIRDSSASLRSPQNDNLYDSLFCSPFPVGEGGEGVRSARQHIASRSSLDSAVSLGMTEKKGRKGSGVRSAGFARSASWDS